MKSMRTRRMMIVPLLVSGAIGAPSLAAMEPEDTRSRIGIGPVEVLSSLQTQLNREGKTLMVGRIREAMDSQLIDRLHNSRKFRIIARSDLKSLLEEQNLAPLLDPETAPAAFRISGIEHMVVVSIDHFEDRTETRHFPHLRQQATRRTIEIGAVAKLWNTETGELLESANWEIGSGDEDLNLPPELRGVLEDDGIRGDGEALNRLLRRMGNVLAQRISDRVTDVLYPAQVTAIMGRQVYINRGDGTDIRPGEIWIVYALGPEMRDPTTGRSLGRVEAEINRVRITRVTPEFSVGEIIESESFGVEFGQVLRRDEMKKTTKKD